jgi:hypothetical protein
MDAAEMTAKRNDANQLNRLSAAEFIGATEIRTAADARHSNFVRDRQQKYDTMTRAMADEQRILAPAPSALPVHLSAPQPTIETSPVANSRNPAAPSLLSDQIPSESEPTVERRSLTPPAISLKLPNTVPNPAVQISSSADVSSSESQDDQRQSLPTHQPILRQYSPTSPSSSAPTSVRSQQRPGSSGQAATSNALSHVSTCDSQESYHTAVTVCPHTPGFASSDPSLSQTNLASGLLTVPEGVAIQSHSPLKHSIRTPPATEGQITPAQPDSGPESMVSNGDSPEGEGTPIIGQSSQSLPIPAEESLKHDVNAISVSVVDGEIPTG